MLFKMVGDWLAPSFNRGLLLNFWLLRSVNHLKFKEEYVMYTEKYVLVRKKKKKNENVYK